MKVITWNVNNRVVTVSQQVQELGQREPDVVALQDVNYNAVSHYIEAFRRIGLAHLLHTLERRPQAVPTSVLLASRFPLSFLADLSEGALWSQGCSTPDREKLRQHWARRTLFALLHCPWGEIELANVYITPANHFEKDGNGMRQLYPYLKLDLLAGVYQTLATRRIGPDCSAAISMRHSTNERTERSSPGATSRDTGTTSSNIPVSMNSSLVFYVG